MPLSQPQQREVAESLHYLLDAVERGTLTADGPAGSALVRRLEGALLALEGLLSNG